MIHVHLVQGRCDAGPREALTPGLGLGTAAAEPWQAPRCVLVVSQDFLIAHSPGLWLDALHIQYTPEDTGSDDATPPADYRFADPYDYDYGCAAIMVTPTVHFGKHRPGL